MNSSNLLLNFKITGSVSQNFIHLFRLIIIDYDTLPCFLALHLYLLYLLLLCPPPPPPLSPPPLSLLNQLHPLMYHRSHHNQRQEVALMADLIPLLHKLAQGREISGLKAYEQ